MPRPDWQSTRSSGRSHYVGEVHFNVGFTRLGEGMLCSYAAFSETGGIDEICVRGLGALVNELKDGPSKFDTNVVTVTPSEAPKPFQRL